MYSVNLLAVERAWNMLHTSIRLTLKSNHFAALSTALHLNFNNSAFQKEQVMEIIMNGWRK